MRVLPLPVVPGSVLSASSTPAKPLAASAGSGDAFVSRKPRFSGLLNEDYHTEFRGRESLTPHAISAILRSLLQQSVIKRAKGDNSSLKLFLDADYTDWFVATCRAAMADTLQFLDRPVDVIVKGSIGSVGMMALQSATGLRLAYEGAELMIGPAENGAPYGRNDDHNIDRAFNNAYLRDYEYRLMQRTGQTNRSKIYWNDLNRKQVKNVLQALAYGDKGLIDGVLVGYDRVVTRADLDAFIAKRKLSGQALADFLKDAHNVRELSSRPLKKISARSIPQEAGQAGRPEFPGGRWYIDPLTRLNRKKAKDTGTADAKAAAAGENTPALKAAAGNGPVKATPAPLPVFYDLGRETELSADEAPLVHRIRGEEIRASHTAIGHPPGGPKGLLEDDVIFFNSGFDDQTAEQLCDALLTLDQKKRGQRNASRIKLLVNSPGGSIVAGQEIRSTIRQCKTPVDIIVTGMAASCGAFLTASVTGLRMATPNARIMIHDAWWQLPRQSNAPYNDQLDSLDAVSRFFAQTIGEAAGRDAGEVFQDMKWDVWLNPLESMFYGDKGLTDVILVGNNRGVTRQDVLAYLAERLGGPEAVDAYLEKHLAGLREGKRQWQPDTHDANNPLANPLETIEAVAKRFAKPLAAIEAMKASLPTRQNVIEHLVIGPDSDDDEA